MTKDEAIDVESERKLFAQTESPESLERKWGNDDEYANPAVENRWQGWLAAKRSIQTDRRTPVSGEVAEGFVLVPRKPTPEMLNALYVTPDFVGSTIIRHSVDKLPAAYESMLQAWQARGQQAGDKLNKGE